MSILDPNTASIMSGAVVAATASTYIVTSLLRRDTGGARLWAFSYLLSLTGVVFYYVWWIGGSAPWASAWALGLGHAATVGALGSLVLGCRAFNRVSVEGPAFLVTALALLTGVATILGAGQEGASSGLLWLLLSSAGLSVGLVYHALTRRMRAYPMSWVFAAAAAVQGAFALARSIALLVDGPDGETFLTWFGSAANAVVVSTAGLVLAISTFVLRTVLAGGHGVTLDQGIAEIIPAPAFPAQLQAVLRRSTERLELVAVIAVRIDDLHAITLAFGGALAEQMTTALRNAARRYASPVALVGDGPNPTTMLVATLASSAADARRQAGLLYRGILRDFIEERDVVLPGIGVGVALSQTLGYHAAVLVDAACRAAGEAGASEEASVVFATVRDLPADPFPVDQV